MPSKNELVVQAALIAAGVPFCSAVECHRLPLCDWPWKSPKRRMAPTCDLFLPAPGIYVEVKGIMTIHAMAKMAWLAEREFSYYVFQSTEEDWDPFVDALIDPGIAPNLPSTQRVDANIAKQAKELRYLTQHPEHSRLASAVSRARIRRYIEVRVGEFRQWCSSWP